MARIAGYELIRYADLRKLKARFLENEKELESRRQQEELENEEERKKKVEKEKQRASDDQLKSVEESDYLESLDFETEEYEDESMVEEEEEDDNSTQHTYRLTIVATEVIKKRLV